MSQDEPNLKKLRVKTKAKEQTGIQLIIKSKLQDNHLDGTENDALRKLEFAHQRSTEINIVSNVHGVGTGKNVRRTEDAHINLFITHHNCVTERLLYVGLNTNHDDVCEGLS